MPTTKTQSCPFILAVRGGVIVVHFPDGFLYPSLQVRSPTDLWVSFQSGHKPQRQVFCDGLGENNDIVKAKVTFNILIFKIFAYN